MEYYDKSLLYRIAQRIGRFIKIDKVTTRSTRGKYARVSVEVDLTKPLLSKFRMHRKVWKIVYEGLTNVCFMCGRYGHNLNNCRSNSDTEAGVEQDLQGDKRFLLHRLNWTYVRRDLNSLRTIAHR
ncbi:hypothetical protein Tsubulata_023132 [Turnera subulata]|uniref:CCHC-type domain-containing protein n=1 Tax=Turnera subulata TaxID=218843 RepID=A0A9Q0F1T5_9ROSI|nr:hypothetical protein Tsubulata_023132 [Turnera subulata]